MRRVAAAADRRHHLNGPAATLLQTRHAPSRADAPPPRPPAGAPAPQAASLPRPLAPGPSSRPGAPPALAGARGAMRLAVRGRAGLEGGRRAAGGAHRSPLAAAARHPPARSLLESRPASPNNPQDVLARHAGDRGQLMVALGRVRNDEERLDLDADGLRGLTQQLLQARPLRVEAWLPRVPGLRQGWGGRGGRGRESCRCSGSCRLPPARRARRRSARPAAPSPLAPRPPAPRRGPRASR